MTDIERELTDELARRAARVRVGPIPYQKILGSGRRSRHPGQMLAIAGAVGSVLAVAGVVGPLWTSHHDNPGNAGASRTNPPSTAPPNTSGRTSHAGRGERPKRLSAIDDWPTRGSLAHDDAYLRMLEGKLRTGGADRVKVLYAGEVDGVRIVFAIRHKGPTTELFKGAVPQGSGWVLEETLTMTSYGKGEAIPAVHGTITDVQTVRTTLVALAAPEIDRAEYTSRRKYLPDGTIGYDYIRLEPDHGAFISAEPVEAFPSPAVWAVNGSQRLQGSVWPRTMDEEASSNPPAARLTRLADAASKGRHIDGLDYLLRDEEADRLGSNTIEAVTMPWEVRQPDGTYLAGVVIRTVDGGKVQLVTEYDDNGDPDPGINPQSHGGAPVPASRAEREPFAWRTNDSECRTFAYLPTPGLGVEQVEVVLAGTSPRRQNLRAGLNRIELDTSKVCGLDNADKVLTLRFLDASGKVLTTREL